MGLERTPPDVLIVDDDHDIRSFLEASMLREGYITRTAVSAQEALAQARQKKPDILLLDLLMPEMSGEELCTVIKQDAELRKIIVFILSASAEVQTKLRCFECGADEYLVKPVDPKEITARIERSLKLRRPKRKEKEKPGADDDTQPLADGYSYGPYIVESLVGSGGMGHVYKAMDPLLERPVAIKVLSQQLCRSQEFVLRFRREARLLASINHLHIATIFNFGEEGADLYFAMQWCAGGSVADLISNHKQVPVADSVNYMIQCCEALAAASRKGIVHRDIKPGNLMFDEGHRIKLVDFGLAYSEGASTHLTDVSEFLGTPLYMSPEQAKVRAIDHRSDIYSLGIVFYQMIYGETPFSGSNPMEIILKHAKQPFPEYKVADHGVPYSVYRIIQKMTEKNPEDRYQQYEDLTADLERLRDSLQNPAEEDLTEASLQDLVEGTPTAPALAFLQENLFDTLLSLFTREKTGILHLRSGDQQAKLVITKQGIALENNSYATEIRQKLAEIFRWPSCESAFSEQIDANSPPSVRIPEILLDAARSYIDIAAIRNSLRQDGRIRRTSIFEQTLSAYPLTAEECFIAYRIEGETTTLDSLSILTAFPEEQILRTVFLLDKIGAVEVLAPEKSKRR